MSYNVQQPSYPAYSHAPSHSTRCAVRGVRYAVRGARRVVRGMRMLPFSTTVLISIVNFSVRLRPLKNDPAHVVCAWLVG